MVKLIEGVCQRCLKGFWFEEYVFYTCIFSYIAHIRPAVKFHKLIKSHSLSLPRGCLIARCALSPAQHPDPLPCPPGQVIVVSVRPQLRVLFTHPLEAGAIHVPLLDWQFVVIRVGSGVNMVDPVLTFARKSTVYFYQVRWEYIVSHPR